MLQTLEGQGRGKGARIFNITCGRIVNLSLLLNKNRSNGNYVLLLDVSQLKFWLRPAVSFRKRLVCEL